VNSQEADSKALLGESSKVNCRDGQFLSRSVSLAAGLMHLHLNHRTVLFDPANARKHAFPAKAHNLLLALCNRSETVEQLAYQLACTGDGVDFIRLYYQYLQLCSQMVEQEFLSAT
jgi:hypothetical protein